MADLKLTPVQPVGMTGCYGFVDRSDGSGGVEWIESAVYEPPAFDLRGLRLELDLLLRDAARILGISASQVSGLERGSLTTDWPELERRLRAAARGGAK